MPLILSFAFVFLEYGRSCKDIGCLPREVCIMAYESCSFGQQENSNCGRYPTCKKNTDQAATQQNAGNVIYHNYKWVVGLVNKTKKNNNNSLNKLGIESYFLCIWDSN